MDTSNIALPSPSLALDKHTRRGLKHEAIREAFDQLRGLPQFIRCTRPTLRFMAKKMVDGMMKELRQLEREQAKEQQAAPCDTPDSSSSSPSPAPSAA